MLTKYFEKQENLYKEFIHPPVSYSVTKYILQKHQLISLKLGMMTLAYQKHIWNSYGDLLSNEIKAANDYKVKVFTITDWLIIRVVADCL